MIWVFWIYRALVALGLLAIALQLAVLGWRRPLEISESAPLLLTLAIVALALAVIALMRRRAASLALLAAAIASTLFLGMLPFMPAYRMAWWQTPAFQYVLLGAGLLLFRARSGAAPCPRRRDHRG